MAQKYLEKLSNYTILFVEDEQGTRDEIEEFLELLFKNVYIAENGKEGYRFYQEYKPDIIITDIHMPYMNGIDMVIKIREIDKKTPVVIISAFTDTKYLLKAVELNLLKYIIKPVNKSKLLDVFECFIDTRTFHQIYKLSDTHVFNVSLSHIDENGIKHQISVKEKTFLQHLIEKKSIVTYEEIEYILYIDTYENPNALRQFIKKLRKKLPEDYIQNIPKEGYCISHQYL